MSRIWKFGQDVDTDQIVPGRFAPYMRPDADVGTAAFIEAHPDFNQFAEPGDLLVAEENFGCGSSREYAPQALRNRGIGAIIAKSFARIFYRNAINLGIPVFVAPEIVDAVMKELERLFPHGDRPAVARRRCAAGLSVAEKSCLTFSCSSMCRIEGNSDTS